MTQVWHDRPRLLDAVLVTIFLFGGTALGTAYVGAYERAGDRGHFYQIIFSPAVRFACGHGLVNTQQTTPALTEFLEERRATLTCDEVPASLTPQPLEGFQAREQYLLLLAGAIWRVRGISWHALHGLAGAMFGVSLALGYLVFRLGMGWTLAAVMTPLWGFSLPQMILLPQIRDFSKLPFFLLAILVAGHLVLTRYRPAIVLLLMAGLGAVFGLGFGIRTDVIAFLFVALVALLVFREKPTTRDIALRVGGCLVTMTAFVVVAWPVIHTHLEGSPVWHIALLGLTDASADWLQLQPSLYRFGYAYSDSFISTTVVAYWARVHADWTALHPADAVAFGSRTYATAARSWYQLLALNFPADFIVRAWAAVRQVLESPFAESSLGAPPGVPAALVRTVYAARASLLQFWGGSLPVPMFLLSGCLMATRNRRQATFFVSAVAFLAGLTALQFQRRHTFHLEIIAFWILGWFVSVAAASLRSRFTARDHVTHHERRRWRTAIAFGFLFLAVVAVPLGVLRAYQDARVDRLLNQYSAAVTTPLPLNGERATDGRTVVISVPFQSIDREPTRQMFTEMVVAEFSGAACDYEFADVTFRYTAQDPQFDFSRQLRVQIPNSDDAPLRIYEPLYLMGPGSKYSPNFSFSGIVLPVSKRSCLTKLSRFSEPDRYPLLLEAIVPPNWPHEAKHETLPGWEPFPSPPAVRTYTAPEDFEVSKSDLGRPLTPIGGKLSYSDPMTTLRPDGSVSVRGVADRPASYLATWPPREVAAGAFLFAEGEVSRGGLTLGLVRNGHWVAQVNVTQTGSFRIMIHVDPGPNYEVTLANNLVNAGRRNAFEIRRLGWLP